MIVTSNHNSAIPPNISIRDRTLPSIVIIGGKVNTFFQSAHLIFLEKVKNGYKTSVTGLAREKRKGSNPFFSAKQKKKPRM